MPPRTGAIAFRYGGIFGGILTVLGAGNVLIQDARHSLGPGANGLVLFSCAWLLATIGLLFAVGILAARENGRLAAGTWAGVIAGAIPGAVLSIFASISAAQQTLADPRYNSSAGMIGVTIGMGVVFILFAGLGGGVGAGLAVLGALIGRSRYREAHPLAYSTAYPPYGAYPGMPPVPYPPYPPYPPGVAYPPAPGYAPPADTLARGYGQAPSYPPPPPAPYPPLPPGAYPGYPPASSGADWGSTPTGPGRGE